MGDIVVPACVAELRQWKDMAEKAMGQLSEEQLHARVNPLQNSVAVIVQHIVGNMHSRWTDWLTSNGEKPDRNREGEFAERGWTREKIMSEWERGWAVTFKAIERLHDADLGRTVMIRNESLTAFAAIVRQTAHYASHVGQIMLIGKHLLQDKWVYLTVPPGGSVPFDAAKLGKK